MKKVRIFCESSSDRLEQKINLYLANAVYEKVFFQFSVCTDGNNDFFSCMIIIE